MSLPEFVPFNKIPRLKRGCVITEKIDGTNGIVHVSDDGIVTAGSRNRWLTLESDNYGFCRWVAEHTDDLKLLGTGYHYGEWWGPGVQRGYGLKEKKFSLFNTSRWGGAQSERPSCCDVVPVLYAGEFTSTVVDQVIGELRDKGSVVSPGFMRPEGIVVFMPQARSMFKVTLEGDGHKGASEAA
jgi:hypothetical protein